MLRLLEGWLRSRIYRRALSMAEIKEDTGTDKLALPAYRKGHPIAFSLCDKDENKDTSKLFGADESLVIPLPNISANAGSGARGTRIELKLNQLTYDGETTAITGSRIQNLQIISHLGSRRVPLHVGFIGSNRVLNDGSSANTLVLQLMNVLKSEVLHRLQ